MDLTSLLKKWLDNRRETKADFLGAIILCLMAFCLHFVYGFAQTSRQAYFDTHSDQLEGLHTMSRHVARQLSQDYKVSYEREVRAEGNFVWFLSRLQPISKHVGNEAASNVVYYFPTKEARESPCGQCKWRSYYSRVVLPLTPGQSEPLSLEELQDMVEKSRCFEHLEEGPHIFGNPAWLEPEKSEQENVRYRLHGVEKTEEGELSLEILFVPRYKAFRDDEDKDRRSVIKQLKSVVRLPGGYHVEND